MNRRDLLFGLALAGLEIDAQEQESGSLYMPKPHVVEDPDLLRDFMDEFAFADLVTASPGIRITHIPVLLNRGETSHGTLFGHIARHNPQSEVLDGRTQAIIVFRGPHSYISPTWYGKSDAVPTWNFAVVHATGRPKPITDQNVLRDCLGKLIRKFEGESSAYDFASLPRSFVDGLMGGIVGFKMDIERLEGKFKLGQERSAADKEAMLKHLASARHERSMYEFAGEFFKKV